MKNEFVIRPVEDTTDYFDVFYKDKLVGMFNTIDRTFSAYHRGSGLVYRGSKHNVESTHWSSAMFVFYCKVGVCAIISAMIGELQKELREASVCVQYGE